MQMGGKVVVVGAGYVGSTAAYAMLIDGVAREIVLLDVNHEKAKGEALDLEHGMQFVPGAKLTLGKDYQSVRGAQVVIITAGANQQPGQTRRELLATNCRIVQSIVTQIKKYNRDCILVMVTNPVDALTYVAWKTSGFPRKRVFGTGTTLDTARLRYYLSELVGVHPQGIHAYMLGEHGDSEFPAWSVATIGGVALTRMKIWNAQRMERAVKHTKQAAYEIISRKGATYYAIGLVVARIVRDILDNSNSMLPLSVVLNGEYGQKNLALSVPVVLGENGVTFLQELALDAKERKQLRASAQIIRGMIDKLSG